MNPLESYMRSMRPFVEPCCMALDGYAAFLKNVGRGDYSFGGRPSPQPDVQAVIVADEAPSAAQLLLSQLEKQAEYVRTELADIEARQRELAYTGATPVAPSTANESGKSASDISSANATKRAQKAWKTRRANAAKLEKQAAGRRKKRASR